MCHGLASFGLESIDEKTSIALTMTVSATIVVAPPVLHRFELGAFFFADTSGVHGDGKLRLTDRERGAVVVQKDIGELNGLARLEAIQLLDEELEAWLHSILFAAGSDYCVHTSLQLERYSSKSNVR